MDVTIRDYIGKANELTAEQVRKLPVGSVVRMHHFDRRHEHVCTDMVIVQAGKRKMLLAKNDYYGLAVERPIKVATDRMCYTEVEG